jgi:hypothetical protein
MLLEKIDSVMKLQGFEPWDSQEWSPAPDPSHDNPKRIKYWRPFKHSTEPVPIINVDIHSDALVAYKKSRGKWRSDYEMRLVSAIARQLCHRVRPFTVDVNENVVPLTVGFRGY